MARSDERAFNQPIPTLVRIAVALGCSPVELIPSLGMQPRESLFHERGVFRLKRVGDHSSQRLQTIRK